MADVRELVDKVAADLSFAEVSQSPVDVGEMVVKVDREKYLAACRRLRDEFGFDYLSFVTCVDYPESLEIVAYAINLETQARVKVLVDLSKEEPEVDSLVEVWPTANWHEREAYDLFGVVFRGHPDLRRILLHEKFEGHPLRKDYGSNPLLKAYE